MNKPSIALVGLFILAYVAPLDVRPFMIPDETRYAEIPREMLVSGDWIVPQLCGIRYFEKPILGYWLNAASMGLFGDNRFAARFPSAVSVGISALLLFLLVRRFAGGRSAGMLAAAAFLTCPMVFAFGVFNVLDSALSLFLTAAMVSFFFAYSAANARRRVGFLALFGFCCGLAFLTKGFLAFAVPVSAAVPFIAWERRGRELCRLAWVPILAALVTVLPWSLVIHHREPSFWHYFFWVEHVKRFFSNDAQHPAPFWYFVPHGAWGMLPWLALVPASISGLRKDDFKKPLVRFALCWFLFPFVFFSASQGKIATYILPCFPPLMVLVTLGLVQYLEKGRTKLFTWGASLLAVVTVEGAALLSLRQVAGVFGPRIYGDGETWKMLLVASGILLWVVLLVFSVRSKNVYRKLGLFCIAPILIMFAAHFMLPFQLYERKTPGGFLMSHADRVGPDSIIVSESELAVAACYFYKRTDVRIFERKGELTWGLSYDDAKERFMDPAQLLALAELERGKNRLILIVRRAHYEQYKDKLPKPRFEDTYGRFTFVLF